MPKLIKRDRLSSLAFDIRKSMCKEKEELKIDWLDSGSTRLNLALSGNAEGGWARGRVINIVGDGSSGKTLVALELCAWCFYEVKRRFPEVKRVTVIYNNIEGVMDFDLVKMYGKEFVDGVEWVQSKSAEAFGRDVGRRINAWNEGEFVLYVVDSLDALTSEASLERFDKAAKSDKPEDGAYRGAEKAGYFSQSFFSNLVSKIQGKDITMVLISQVRMKIDRMAFGEKYYRTGGKALDFYTHQVVWLSVVDKPYKTLGGIKWHYGVEVVARQKRSKVSKPFGEAEFFILWDHGIVDAYSLFDFLKNRRGVFPFGGKDFTRDGLITYVDANKEVLHEMREMAQKKWNMLQEKSVVFDLKRKYSED